MDRATRASERLSDLLESLLDVSRIATGRLTLSRESFDLVETAREIIGRLAEAAKQAGCLLSIDAREAVVGSWDKLRIEQVLTNLLSNAFKYAAGSPVEFIVERQADSAIVEVRDRGRGLPVMDMERLFNRFERASPGEYGGLGLGLYVARQVTEAHGGTISGRNIDGDGACFTVRLPFSADGNGVGPSARSAAAERSSID